MLERPRRSKIAINCWRRVTVQLEVSIHNFYFAETMLSYSLHNQTMTNLNLNPKNTGEKASHKNKRPTTVSTTKTRTRIIYLLVACLLAVHLFFVLTNSTIGRPWTSTIDFSSSKVNNKYGDHGNNDAMNTTKHSSNKSSPGQRNFT